MAVMTRGAVVDEIIARAQSSPTYRAQLLRDPRGVVAHQLGLDIPSGVTITVLQETRDTYFVVLPHRVEEGHELPDHDLERVAGGIADKTCTRKTLDTFVAVG
jgi:hypothetical protein